MAVKAHRIVIEPPGIRGERGQRYRMHFEGTVLIDDTWNLEFEACHALVARGITGRLETCRTGKTHRDMIVPDIEARQSHSHIKSSPMTMMPMEAPVGAVVIIPARPIIPRVIMPIHRSVVAIAAVRLAGIVGIAVIVGAVMVTVDRTQYQRCRDARTDPPAPFTMGLCTIG
jgi:hypothetical protein